MKIMSSVITGIVMGLQVSGISIAGADGELGEATVTIGKQRGKFDPVGTNVSMHTTGMQTVEGSMSKRWVAAAGEVASGSGGLFQALVDGDEEFSIIISGSSANAGKLTVSGCIAGDRGVRSAPGTEVMMETLTFTGLDWGNVV